jgi:hypothetical protein
LDLWFERGFRKSCRGEAYYFRYADDFLACFQCRDDAERFLKDLEVRLGKFHLEMELSKTQLIEFGRFAEMNAARKGGKPATFDFLGFTHYCGQTRHGAFKVKRMTSKKKYRAKLQAVKEWLRTERNRVKTGELLGRGKRLLEGHLEYYAITDNGKMCNEFRRQVGRQLFKWLNRRSQRRSYTWERFNDALAWISWPSVRIKHPLDTFRRGAPRWHRVKQIALCF